MKHLLASGRWGSLGMQARLYVMTGVLTLALVGMAVAGWWRLGTVHAEADAVAREHLAALARLSDLELGVTRAALQLRHALLVRTPEERQAALEAFTAERKRVAALAAKGAPSTEGMVFWTAAELLARMTAEGQNYGAVNLLASDLEPAQQRWLQVLAAERASAEQAVQQATGRIAETADRIRLEQALLAVGVAAALFVSTWQLGVHLRRRLRVAKQAAQRVAAGDLATPIEDPVRDELSILIAALRDMQRALAAVVGEVREGVHGVATASEQIALGNAELSSRTESQAGALQEAAASMQGMAGSLQASAEHARAADRLAAGATAVADRGGRAVQDVVAVMGEIEAGSRRIADIIGVIDGIAFQTNILALNAAVEAARAGDQGRGFAVVAAEVRSLAQRSAEAAKEIKALIGQSVERVAAGSTVAAEAGRTMEEVLGQVKRVTALIGEISTAGGAQASGVAQVSGAVSQIDEATQANAALVEQSAAAAEGLRQQASALARAVAVFKVA